MSCLTLLARSARPDLCDVICGTPSSLGCVDKRDKAVEGALKYRNALTKSESHKPANRQPTHKRPCCSLRAVLSRHSRHSAHRMETEQAPGHELEPVTPPDESPNAPPGSPDRTQRRLDIVRRVVTELVTDFARTLAAGGRILTQDEQAVLTARFQTMCTGPKLPPSHIIVNHTLDILTAWQTGSELPPVPDLSQMDEDDLDPIAQALNRMVEAWSQECQRAGEEMSAERFLSIQLNPARIENELRALEERRRKGDKTVCKHRIARLEKLRAAHIDDPITDQDIAVIAGILMDHKAKTKRAPRPGKKEKGTVPTKTSPMKKQSKASPSKLTIDSLLDSTSPEQNRGGSDIPFDCLICLACVCIPSAQREDRAGCV